MPFSQKQIRDHNIATTAAAATLGRTGEIAYIADKNQHFYYTVNAALVDDGIAILPAQGVNAHWVIVGTVARKDNLLATVAPAATDDYAAGYVVGSLWVDITLDETYLCVDSTNTAAVWKKTSNIAGIKDNYAGTVAPSVTDDVLAGYVAGSRWIDTVASASYTCIDSTAAAAVWVQTNNVAGIKNNYTATVVPTATDDSSLGYVEGSEWVDTLNNVAYKCIDSTVTAAIWKQISNFNEERNNYAAIAAPTVTADAVQSYSIGSQWIDTLADKSYICLDNTTGAAVWKETTPAAQLLNNYTAIVAPLATDDSAAGYAIGSHWVDTVTDKSYICLDSTATAAVWKETTAAAQVLNNFAAIVAPSSTDDSAAGYAAGSQWIDTVTGKSYICTSATAGAASWAVTDYIDATHNYAALVAPAPTDDITAGYTVGSKWLDTVSENMYVCVNHTAAAAVWHQIDQTITAGVVTTLDYVYLYDSTAAHAANVDIPLTTFNIVDDAAGLVSAAGITIAKAGRYEIIYTAGVAVSSAGSDTIALYVDGVQVNKTATGGLAVGNQVPNALTYQATLSVGQVITIRTAISPVIGDIQLSVKQLPVETVVPAGSAKANFTAIVPPAITDSTANGYALGSQWVDTVANASYICVDATAGAAIWMPVTTPSLPKYSASHQVGGGLATTTGTLINMDTTNLGSVIYDPTAMAAGTQVTVASAGDYLVQYSFMSINTQTGNIQMLLNGVATMQNIQTSGYSGGTSAAIIPLSVGDIITFDTGGALPYGWNCVIAKQP